MWCFRGSWFWILWVGGFGVELIVFGVMGVVVLCLVGLVCYSLCCGLGLVAGLVGLQFRVLLICGCRAVLRVLVDLFARVGGLGCIFGWHGWLQVFGLFASLVFGGLVRVG